MSIRSTSLLRHLKRNFEMLPISINYEPLKGKFTITAPIWLNDKVRSIPSRRFNKTQNNWHAPATRLNIMHMERELSGASWSRLALEKLAEVKSNLNRVAAPALPWPLHYKFKTEPMPTQRIACERAFGRPAFAYFKDMGTGKTKTLIDLACASRMHPLIEAVLIICPIGLRENWVRELAIHSPLPVSPLLLNSDRPQDFEKWLNTPHDFKWLLVGVESLGISTKAYDMVLQYLTKTRGRVLTAIDESSKIKNHAALRSTRSHFIGAQSAIRIPMTGTPLAKSVMDLYSQFEFMDPDILGVGDFYSFRNRYAVMGGYEGKEMIGYQNIDELMEVIAPFVYQVRKEEVLPDLPPKSYTQRRVRMTTAQSKYYRQMAKDRRVLGDDGRGSSVKNVLGVSLRLQQIAGGHVPMEIGNPFDDTVKVVAERIDGKNPKIDDLLEFCEEFDGQMIVWAAFRPEIDWAVTALREKYGHDQVVECHGGIDAATRDVGVNEIFQSGRARFVVGNVATGGMGLTMTAATCEFYMSNTHNYIDRAQSEDRAHRKGQTNAVLYVDQIAQIDMGRGEWKDGIDAAIVASNNGKKDLATYIKGQIDEVHKRGEDFEKIFGC